MPTASFFAPIDIDAKTAKAELVSAAKAAALVSMPIVSYRRQGDIKVHRVVINLNERDAEALMSTRIGKESIHEMADKVFWHARTQRAKAEAALQPESMLSAMVAHGLLKRRDEQFEVEAAIQTALNAKQALMIEGATGIGKTAAALSAAMRAAPKIANQGEPTMPVIIAVPKLALMNQYHREAERIRSLGLILNIAYIAGRAEFVSETRLQDVLMDIETNTESRHSLAIAATVAKEWRDKQASTPIDGPNVPWSQRSLREALARHGMDGSFPPVHLSAMDADNDSGERAYRAQFDRAEQADIVLCTHAMLCIDARVRMSAIYQDRSIMDNPRLNALYNTLNAAFIEGSSRQTKASIQSDIDEFKLFLIQEKEADIIKGSEENSIRYRILPDYNQLLIDEAHEFESAMARCMSREVSVYALCHDRSLSPAVRKKLFIKLEALVNLGILSDRESINLRRIEADDDMGELTQKALAMLKAIRMDLGRAKKSDSRHVVYARQSLDYALNINNRSNFIAEIDFSPVYQYPRIRAGLSTVKNQLKFFWQRTAGKGGTALLSATLMVNDARDKSTKFMSDTLALPDILRGHKIIHPPKWITSPVTLLQPEDTPLNGRKWLEPPSSAARKKCAEKYAHDLEDYLTELANYCEWVALTQAGGALVLLSSYDLAEKIFKRLSERPLFSSDSMALIASRRNQSLQDTKQEYTAAYYAGKKPFWIAVGSAGTGLDLTDETLDQRDRSRDLMLTDLIIPRVPIGVNQSLTHETRKNRAGQAGAYKIERMQTILTLRQWMGRLVRCEGISNNRRIHLLDSRIFAPQWMCGMRASIEELIRPYRRDVTNYKSLPHLRQA